MITIIVFIFSRMRTSQKQNCLSEFDTQGFYQKVFDTLKEFSIKGPDELV